MGKEYNIYKPQGEGISEIKTRVPALGPRDVLLRITHSGVCNADASFAKKGVAVALGHEGVGIVEAVGSEVTLLKVGDRAGGGFHRDSCRKCHYCLSGRDILCSDRVIFGQGDADNGTFSRYFVGKETYVHKIPDALASEHAAPLQCAGATTYKALKATAGPKKRVGVIGIGGLGHLAIQFAASMGSTVVALSTTSDKEQEARQYGADEFVLLKELNVKEPLDVIVLTSSTYPDFRKIMDPRVLARDGTMVPLTSPTEPMTLPAGSMLGNAYHIYSSMVASRAEHDEMLEFAAHRGIRPAVQVFKHSGAETIQRIFQDLLDNKIRYRAVLEL
ncbi:hypothetical protein Plec18167_003661 [Paecilomyces lecythidis]|uniref:Enoyl reductase (ER) domain-containing protein n=1 Tax=Paecilomyces lecythidis TaxID=3004212 RepID=A0ABR3XXC1_9EURO